MTRVLLPWAPPNQELNLSAVYPQDKKSMIVIGITSAGKDGQGVEVAYASTDHGNSWQQIPEERATYSNLAVRVPHDFLYSGVTSSQNPDCVWRPMAGPGNFSVSRDGGKSWEKVSASIKGDSPPRNFDLFGSGKHDEGRIYARVRLHGEEEFSLYRSDNYGKTFAKLSSEVHYAVESRADRSLLIGLSDITPGIPKTLAISKDGGLQWKEIQSKFLIEPLVNGPLESGEVVIKTRIEKPLDVYLKFEFSIVQIETDPSDANTFYVLTQKGLYRTFDQGKTFALLPLATDLVGGMINIAVDPVDGRYVYALVTKSDIYRSSDHGCEWEKLEMPKP